MSALKRVWRSLPEGPLSEREIEEHVLRVTGHYSGDFAWAGAVVGTLVSARAVTVRQDERGQAEYVRGEWTDWVDPGPGTDAYNAELARVQGLYEAERDRADRESGRYDNPEYGRLVEFVDRRIDDRIAELLGNEDAVVRMRQRLADTEAGEGQPEGAES